MMMRRVFALLIAVATSFAALPASAGQVVAFRG